ncbi:major facilitator superfamily domain-containing protein [Roridomyces roridus]|uniref:Major facilitator superfamily domain-containing protein n=1 Tax=Roridomyces roridus TaxID=1738132 RepID=A0AAD7CL75_9AGAR|nr:major facilitator superfamily domain-containing protein [Roridomyces roridus]
MVNGVQFILYFIFGAETLYIHDTQEAKAGFLGLRRIDPRPLTLEDFVHPFRFFLKPRVCLPAISHSMIFLWASIMPNILMPQIFPAKFGLDTQQVGLQFLAAIVGSVIGEQLGGRTSDWWMRRRQRALAGKAAAPPEYRLWLSYIGCVLSIIGVVVFCVQVERAGRKWNITPLVGVAIASVGNQLSTTVLITYAVDCYRLEAASVGVFISFVRQIWGFIGPFWIPHLITATSFDATAGIAAASLVVFSIILIVWLQQRGSFQGLGGKDHWGAAEDQGSGGSSKFGVDITYPPRLAKVASLCASESIIDPAGFSSYGLGIVIASGRKGTQRLAHFSAGKGTSNRSSTPAKVQLVMPLT